MTRLANIYWAFLRAQVMIAFEYRAQIFIWIISGLIPLIMMMVWITISEQQGGEVGGFDRNTFISYYLGVLVIRRMTGCWLIWEIDEHIRLGKLNNLLLKPVDPGHRFFTMVAADKPVEFSLIFPVVAVAAIFFGAQYAWSFTAILLVIVTTFCGFLIEFMVTMVVGMTAFWITQVISVMSVWFWTRAFFSGWMIPLALFPEAVQEVLIYLPFRYVISFPLEILMGWVTPAEILFGFGVIAVWLTGLFSLYRFLWSRGLRQYSAVGA